MTDFENIVLKTCLGTMEKKSMVCICGEVFAVIWSSNIINVTKSRIMKIIQNYTPKGRRNHGRPLKRLLDA